MKKKWLILLLFLVFIALLIILYLLFGREKSFTITFDSNGGTEISNIEVKDGEIVKLPESPIKNGYTFVGWTNEDGKVITRGTKVTDDITLKAEWISKDAETNTIEFNTDGGNEIDNILIENGKIILLPVDPIKEGYIFICWVDEDGNFITKDMIITKNIILKAIWMKKDAKTVTINFDTDGGSNIESITVESGKLIILPINPTKAGYVFAGWILENGDAITKDYIVDKNITIKAVWKEPYTCPDDCTPIGDGSKCTKEVTTNMQTSTACPKGYALYDNLCLDITNQYHAISIDADPYWKCNSADEYMYSQLDGVGGAYMWCAKKASKVTTKSCPNGYTESGDICKKEETISCKAN